MTTNQSEVKLPSLKKPKLLRDQVYEVLRERILNGDFPSGYKLQEAQLATQLDVSRTPVREAIQRLQVEGLVIDEKGPPEVVEVTLENLEASLDVREVLEVFACKLATERRSAEHIKRLDDLHALEASALQAKDFEALRNLNAAIHNEILEASHNEVLQHLVNFLYARVPSFSLFAVTNLDTLQEFWESHSRIIEAIERGDAQQAEKEMSAHIKLAKRVLFRQRATQ